LHLPTKRLNLTPLEVDDAPALHVLWTTPQVREFLWDGKIIPPAQTLAVVTESARLFTAHAFGLWGARLRGTGALAGFGGLWYFRKPPELELLYGVAADDWGKGFATELAGAVVSYAFQMLGHKVIRARPEVSA
jgi:ribosomal-protein-alanine N-acetyltransferase